MRSDSHKTVGRAKLCVGLATLIWCAAATPAFAFSDPCNALSARLRAIDTAWLKFDLKDRFPGSQGKILRPVAIAENSDLNQLGPVYDRRQNRILVPRRFLQTQCHMVLLQVLYKSEPTHDYAEVGRTARVCVASGRSKLTCLDEAITKFLATLTIEKRPPELANNALQLFAITVYAIRFQLAHEAGHILTEAINSVQQMREIDTELEADILAELSTVGDSPIIAAPLYAMATASLVDPAADDLHGPTICRLERTKAVIGELGGPALLLSNLNRRSNEIDLRPLAVWVRALRKPLFTGPTRSDCGRQSDIRLFDVEKDLDALFKAIGLVRSGATATLTQPEIADANLAGLALKTAAGARLRAVLRMEIAMKRYDFNGLTAGITEGKATADSFQTYLDQLENIRSIIGDDPGAYFRPSELAALLFTRAMTSYIRQPPGSSLLQNTRNFVKDLQEIDAIDPIEDQIRATVFILGLNESDGRTSMQLILWRLEIEAGMYMILGKCAEMNQLLQGARAATGAPPSTPMSDAECRAGGRDSGRKFAEGSGWKFDLP